MFLSLPISASPCRGTASLTRFRAISRYFRAWRRQVLVWNDSAWDPRVELALLEEEHEDLTSLNVVKTIINHP
jgi:hypothetical protein